MAAFDGMPLKSLLDLDMTAAVSQSVMNGPAGVCAQRARLQWCLRHEAVVCTTYMNLQRIDPYSALTLQKVERGSADQSL